VLSLQSEAREVLGSETARVHHASRRRGGRVAPRGAGAEYDAGDRLSWHGFRGAVSRTACFATKSTRVWQVAVQGPRHRSRPPVICTLVPPPISRRGSLPTARRSWATFPTTQISHHRFRLVRSL